MLHLQGMIRCVHFSIVITMYVQGRFFPATTRTETKTEQRRRLTLICVAKWGNERGRRMLSLSLQLKSFRFVQFRFFSRDIKITLPLAEPSKESKC